MRVLGPGSNPIVLFPPGYYVRGPKLHVVRDLLPEGATIERDGNIEIADRSDLTPELLQGYGVDSITCHATTGVRIVAEDGTTIAQSSSPWEDEWEGLHRVLALAAVGLARATDWSDYSEWLAGLLAAHEVWRWGNDPTGERLGRHAWPGLVGEWVSWLHSKSPGPAGPPPWVAEAFGFERYYARFLSEHKPFARSDDPFRRADRLDYTLLLTGIEGADLAKGPAAKGEALQAIARRLFSGLDGMWILREKLRTGTGEMDLLVQCDCELALLRSLGKVFFVECKNERRSVETDDIGSLLTDMREFGVGGAVVVSRCNVSPDGKRRIREAHITGNGSIAVVTLGALRGLRARGAWPRLLCDAVLALHAGRG